MFFIKHKRKYVILIWTNRTYMKEGNLLKKLFECINVVEGENLVILLNIWEQLVYDK